MYNNAISSLTFHRDSYTRVRWDDPSQDHLYIVANNLFGFSDAYHGSSPLTGAAVRGRNPLLLQIDLLAPQAHSATTPLLRFPLSLNVLNTRNFQLIFSSGGRPLVKGTEQYLNNRRHGWIGQACEYSDEK